jgi:hypothetical protein
MIARQWRNAVISAALPALGKTRNSGELGKMRYNATCDRPKSIKSVLLSIVPNLL